MNDHDSPLDVTMSCTSLYLAPLKFTGAMPRMHDARKHAITEHRVWEGSSFVLPGGGSLQILSVSIPHASPMPDPNTTVVKPAEHEGDIIRLYDHSVPPLPARSTSTERFRQRTGFSAFYYNPVTQVCLLGLVCFMCPGSFNALNGLGAAGRVDSTVNSNSNSALYATFTVAAFFAG